MDAKINNNTSNNNNDGDDDDDENDDSNYTDNYALLSFNGDQCRRIKRHFQSFSDKEKFVGLVERYSSTSNQVDKDAILWNIINLKDIRTPFRLMKSVFRIGYQKYSRLLSLDGNCFKLKQRGGLNGTQIIDKEIMNFKSFMRSVLVDNDDSSFNRDITSFTDLYTTYVQYSVSMQQPQRVVSASTFRNLRLKFFPDAHCSNTCRSSVQLKNVLLDGSITNCNDEMDVVVPFTEDNGGFQLFSNTMAVNDEIHKTVSLPKSIDEILTSYSRSHKYGYKSIPSCFPHNTVEGNGGRGKLLLKFIVNYEEIPSLIALLTSVSYSFVSRRLLLKNWLMETPGVLKFGLKIDHKNNFSTVEPYGYCYFLTEATVGMKALRLIDDKSPPLSLSKNKDSVVRFYKTEYLKLIAPLLSTSSVDLDVVVKNLDPITTSMIENKRTLDAKWWGGEHHFINYPLSVGYIQDNNSLAFAASYWLPVSSLDTDWFINSRQEFDQYCFWSGYCSFYPMPFGGECKTKGRHSSECLLPIGNFVDVIFNESKVRNSNWCYSRSHFYSANVTNANLHKWLNEAIDDIVNKLVPNRV